MFSLNCGSFRPVARLFKRGVHMCMIERIACSLSLLLMQLKTSVKWCAIIRLKKGGACAPPLYHPFRLRAWASIDPGANQKPIHSLQALDWSYNNMYLHVHVNICIIHYKPLWSLNSHCNMLLDTQYLGICIQDMYTTLHMGNTRLSCYGILATSFLKNLLKTWTTEQWICYRNCPLFFWTHDGSA